MPPKRNKQSLTILGVDPGLAQTGYGFIALNGDQARLLDGGVVSTSDKDPLPQRLAQIHRRLLSLLTEKHPQIISVEGLYSQYRHPKTAILMGHARATILLCAQSENLPVVEYPPATIKQAITGSGKASKEQVRGMVCALLHLEDEELSDHTSDALACALTHLIKEDLWL